VFIHGILGKYADVTEAPDGLAAWNLIQNEHFDLLLSDIMVGDHFFGKISSL
jgi:CheY-like chemotaxis protein